MSTPDRDLGSPAPSWRDGVATLLQRAREMQARFAFAESFVPIHEAVAILDAAEARGETALSLRAEASLLEASGYLNGGAALVQATAAVPTAHDERTNACLGDGGGTSEDVYARAAALMNRGNHLLSLGGVQALREAVMAHEEAIDLLGTLDLSLPRGQNNLASALSNKGNALRSLGGAEALRDATAVCNEAIGIYRALDLSEPQYRNNLTTALVYKANALLSRGTAEELSEAIAAYNEAIDLRRALDLSVAEYRDDLASTPASKGYALLSVGMTKAARDAKAAFDEAIDFFRTLDISVPSVRNNLAHALTEKANVLLSLDSGTALRDAVVAYDEAIDLSHSLDLSVPRYSKIFAQAWIDRGRALARLDPLDTMGNARDSFAMGWRYFAEFIATAGSPDPELVQGTLYAAFSYQNFLQQRRDWETSTDVGDVALEAARALEAAGITAQRGNRALVFAGTLEAYRRERSYRALVEVIFEQLDPSVPGSAAESAAMHATAAAALRDATVDVMSGGGAIGEVLGLLLQAQTRLQGLHTLCFGGTAQSARLHARLAQARGQTEQAEKILAQYLTARPDDPDGPFVMAEWYLQHHRRAPALAAFAAAARLLSARIGATSTAAVDRMATIVRAMLGLRLQEVAETAATDDARDTLTSHFNKLEGWLLKDLPQIALADLPEGPWRAWSEALAPVLAAAWEETAHRRETLATQWQDQRDAVKRAEGRLAALDDALNLVQRMFDTIAALPADWETATAMIRAALLEAERVFGVRPEDEAREKIVATLAEALRRLTGSLTQDVLAAASEKLAAVLGPLWETALEPEERQYLAFALRLRESAEYTRYAPLELGNAVEWSLTRRLFQPVRRAVIYDGLKLPMLPDKRHERVRASLAAEQGALMLGELLGGFGSALSRMSEPEATPRDVFHVLADRLRGLPNPAVLQMDRALWKRRAAALEALNELRKRVAHPEPPGPPRPEEVDRAWHEVVEDAELAVYRYFPAAFLRPSQTAA